MEQLGAVAGWVTVLEQAEGEVPRARGWSWHHSTFLLGSVLPLAPHSELPGSQDGVCGPQL